MKVKLPSADGAGETGPNPHEAVIEFGKHKGQLLTRVPPGYLRWAVQNEVEGKVRLKNGLFMPLGQIAKVEMERRGERLSQVEVTGHAIDRLSAKFIGHWSTSGMGLYSWAERQAAEAWEKRQELEARQQDDGAWQIPLGGIVWVIEEMAAVLVVKTVK